MLEFPFLCEESGQIDKLNEEVARLKKVLAERAAEAASGGGDSLGDSGGGPVNDEVKRNGAAVYTSPSGKRWAAWTRRSSRRWASAVRWR